jgi:hypothetical protein
MGSVDTSPEEVVRSEHQPLIELERQLLAMHVGQTERDWRIVQLTGQLALKSAQLEHAEANVAGAKKRAGLEQRELHARLDELLLSRNQAEANASYTLLLLQPAIRRASPAAFVAPVSTLVNPKKGGGLFQLDTAVS